MKILYFTFLYFSSVIGQDPDPDTTTKEDTTTTAAETTAATTATPTIKCKVCSASTIDGVLAKGDISCFEDLDNIASEDFGQDGACMSEGIWENINGVITRNITRSGTKDRGDASKYPRETLDETLYKICNTESCNDEDATNFFPESIVSKNIKMPSREYEYSDDARYGDDETTTKAVPTTTVAPGFTCFQCDGRSENGNLTELGECLNPKNSAAEMVCGNDGVGSCQQQFKRQSDTVEGLDVYLVERACNVPGDKNENLKHQKDTMNWACIDKSDCNDIPMESAGTTLCLSIILIIFVSLF